MSESNAKASKVNQVFPWLLHFSIIDERIGDFRGDSYAIKSSEGLVVIDPSQIEDAIKNEVSDAKFVILTAGGHQRSSWRYRKDFGAKVFAPVGSKGLDEEPDFWYGSGEEVNLPAGIEFIKGTWYSTYYHLVYTHADETKVLFCGDLITQSEGEPYRFPIGKSMPPYDNAREEVKKLLELSANALCPAHADPTADGCNLALQSALDFKY